MESHGQNMTTTHKQATILSTGRGKIVASRAGTADHPCRFPARSSLPLSAPTPAAERIPHRGGVFIRGVNCDCLVPRRCCLAGAKIGGPQGAQLNPNSCRRSEPGAPKYHA